MKNEIVAFDYARLDGDQRIIARTAAAAIKERLGKTAKNYIEIGNELLKVKAALRHGEFSKWLASEFAATERTAQNMMRAAEFAAKNETVSYLTDAPSALLILSAQSTPPKAKERVAARAAGGEKISAKIVREEIAAAKTETVSLLAAELPADKQNEVAEAEKPTAALRKAKAEAETVSLDPLPIAAAESNPLADYNAALAEYVKTLESVARGITQAADFDKGHNAQCEFAKGHLYHDGTVALIRKVKRTLDECQIAGKRGDRYITKREADHTARVAASRKEAV